MSERKRNEKFQSKKTQESSNEDESNDSSDSRSENEESSSDSNKAVSRLNRGEKRSRSDSGDGDDSRHESETKTQENEKQEDKGNEDEDEDEIIGPQPVIKKKKVIPFEKIYLDNLPLSEAYERSYMHRDTLKFVIVARNTHFIITGSVDGHIKFWIKKPIGIEFVKHFRAHLSTIVDMSVNNPLGTLLATISDDKSLKIFDIVNFDMINMFKLNFVPSCVEWCYSTISSTTKDPFPVVAVSDADSNKIYTYEGIGSKQEPLSVLDRIHMNPLARMRFNAVFSTMVSVDRKGMLEYWGTHRNEYRFPSNVVAFESKMETDLYDLAKVSQYPHDIAFSPDGKHFAMICSDRKIRLYRFLTGKLIRIYDESLQQLTALQQTTPQLPNMEFGRRMATERDLEKSDLFHSQNILFDDSGYFLIYPTMLGIKIINWYTNKLVKMIGKVENFRPISLSIHQQIPDVKNVKSTVTPTMAASKNPTLEASSHTDPTIFCTGFRKNRIYMFTKREPDDSSMAAPENGMLTGLERDVFNEKPSREDMIAATTADSAASANKLAEACCIHTTHGDIHIKLFSTECPKTVENFVTHSRNGYYNGHIFHRVIRQFMIQTGDPTGSGTGGQSIWGGEFEDEIVPTLKHDKPFTLSMANAGPNTNGSQFFITVIPTPWLDGKHTVFGRVTKGMDVVQGISQVRTHPKTDKPYDDIKIINIQIK